jgi:predicted HAD superfamily Cof-like phosphohydrolase
MLVRDQVKEFHEKFGVKDLEKPGIPDPAKIRLRAKLIFEEYTEMMKSLGFESSVLYEHMAELDAWDPDPAKVDLVEFADATGDLKYVIAGAELSFGIDGEPISAEIHRTNMAKVGGGTRDDGKIRKPVGWMPPDIKTLLYAQGWGQ